MVVDDAVNYASHIDGPLHLRVESCMQQLSAAIMDAEVASPTRSCASEHAEQFGIPGPRLVSHSPFSACPRGWHSTLDLTDLAQTSTSHWCPPLVLFYTHTSENSDTWSRVLGRLRLSVRV